MVDSPKSEKNSRFASAGALEARLAELKRMRDAGQITEEEYKAKKERLSTM